MVTNVSLALAEIAAWQIPHSPAVAGSVVAALPALQRSAVWKVKQIEELWDSILRSFPVGSFVISRIDENKERGTQNYKLQPDKSLLPEPTHYLLDGQQRATGIALGFYDVWRSDVEASKVKSVGWIDLDIPPSSRDVVFLFRVITRAHPWGYSRTDPDKRLSENQIRSALKAFQVVNSPLYSESRPEDFPLTLTWPWDAGAPVPLPMLIAAVYEHKEDLQLARSVAWARIEKLPLFARSSFTEQESEGGAAKPLATCAAQRNNVRAAFTDPDSPYFDHLTMILKELSAFIGKDTAYRVPLLHLNLNGGQVASKNEVEGDAATNATANQSAKKDPVELLFVRINSAGTPLEGEELIYSLLKSAWTDAPKFIEELTHKPALPSRIAMLCIRLVLARRQIESPRTAKGGKRLSFPPAPGVDEFRRLVRNLNPAHPNFFESLQDFVQTYAATLFEEAWHFLTVGNKHSKNASYALPPVLAVELAQKAPDVFFLLLRWIDRLHIEGIDVALINEHRHRRILGFLTSLAWFAPDKTRAAASVWDALQEADGERLKNFFNSRHFTEACRLDERNNVRMIPLPTADELDLLCKKHVTGYQGCQNTITEPDSEIWTRDWNWYSCINKMAEKMKESYTQKMYPATLDDGDDVLDMPEVTRSSFQNFFNTLNDSRSILIFAQRSWLMQWFTRFDPSQPEYMEDKNRPWDYDHIHPQNYLRSDSGSSLHNIPQVIRDWHGSIGNLRAWPLEANRADGDTCPTKKLTEISNEEKRYNMKCGDERSASFVHDDIDWPWWQVSVPKDDNCRHYLKSSEYHIERRALIMAIVTRFGTLYREWYEVLKIDSLQ